MYKTLFLLQCIITIHLIKYNATQETDENIYSFYPCSESTKLIETFKKSNPPEYNLTILLPNFLISPNSLDLRLKFDIETITVEHFSSWIGSSNGTFVNVQVIVEEPINLTFTISPFKGNKLPNVLSVKLNSREICNGVVYKNIWDNYMGTVEETTPGIAEIKQVPNKSANLCGKSIIHEKGYIVEGLDSTPGKWPWHTALYRLQNDGEMKYICGGTLISKTSILTAGHCVMESGSIVLTKRVLAILGKYNFIGNNVNLQEKTIYEIMLHPNFSISNLQNDIAILKLTSEVAFNDYVQPICLLSKYDVYQKMVKSNNTYGYAVGWGATQYNKYADQLVESKLPIVDKLTCMKSHRVFLYKLLLDGSFCAGDRNGTNVCNGDSGGGLFFKSKGENSESIWYLGGIISLAIPQRNRNKCDPYNYALFTDVFYYKEFVDERL